MKYCPQCGVGQTSADYSRPKSFYLYGHPFLLSSQNIDILEQHQEYRKIGERYADEFAMAYSRCTSASKALTVATNLAAKYYLEMAKRQVEKLSDLGIDTIDELSVVEHLFPYLQFPVFLNGLYEKLIGFEEARAYEINLREQRKSHRGKLVGGGIGLLGALRGIILANMVNSLSGAAYSVKNNIGNHFTNERYNREIQKICSRKVINGLCEVLVDDCITFCDYGQEDNVYSVAKRLEAYMFFEKLQAAQMELSEKEQVFVKLLTIYPAQPCFYTWAERNLSNSFGELQRLRDFLGV